MGLFTPAWKGKNEEKALAFIEKCRKPELLKRIAREAPSPMRRVAAAERVEDEPELLKEAAKILPNNVLVDHFSKLAENGDLRGIDILAMFLQEHGQSYDAHRAAVTIRDLYSKASYSGNEELKRRGLDPPERWEADDYESPAQFEESRAQHFAHEDAAPDAELAERQRKFGMMMKPFQI